METAPEHDNDHIIPFRTQYTQQIFFKGEWAFIYDDLWFDTPEECEDLWTCIEPWKYNDEPTRIVAIDVSDYRVYQEDSAPSPSPKDTPTTSDNPK